MAHFAEVDPVTKTVGRVVYTDALTTADMLTQTVGGSWVKCDDDVGVPCTTVQSGFTYDPVTDTFVAPIEETPP